MTAHQHQHARLSRRPVRDAEAGGVAPLVAVLLLCLVAVVGLVGDGGRLIVAKRRAINQAEQAARAGAQALDPLSLRTGGPYRLTPPAAAAAANRYLGQLGVAGTAQATPTSVEVTVHFAEPTLLLGVIGIDQFSGTGTASATVVAGVSGAQP